MMNEFITENSEMKVQNIFIYNNKYNNRYKLKICKKK